MSDDNRLNPVSGPNPVSDVVVDTPCFREHSRVCGEIKTHLEEVATLVNRIPLEVRPTLRGSPEEMQAQIVVWWWTGIERWVRKKAFDKYVVKKEDALGPPDEPEESEEAAKLRHFNYGVRIAVDRLQKNTPVEQVTQSLKNLLDMGHAKEEET